MTRSRKKHPISWLCSSCHSDMKKWKVQQNRKIRHTDPLEEIPEGSHYKKKSEIWNSPSDGKCNNSCRFNYAPYKRNGK